MLVRPKGKADLSRALPPSLHHETSEVKSAARLWEVSEEAEGLKGSSRLGSYKLGHETLDSCLKGQQPRHCNGFLERKGWGF